MDRPNQPNQETQKIIIKTVRITGFIILLMGGGVFFNLGGIANQIGFSDDGAHHFIGGAIAILGMMDIILVPRILDAAWNKKM